MCAWWRDAACRGTDPDVFFTVERRHEAARLCASCPVRVDCARAGEREPVGVWGGVWRDLLELVGPLECARGHDLTDPVHLYVRPGDRPPRRRCGTCAQMVRDGWFGRRERADPLDVDCPTCLAPVGVRCQNPARFGGRFPRARPHDDRHHEANLKNLPETP